MKNKTSSRSGRWVAPVLAAVLLLGLPITVSGATELKFTMPGYTTEGLPLPNRLLSYTLWEEDLSAPIALGFGWPQQQVTLTDWFPAGYCVYILVNSLYPYTQPQSQPNGPFCAQTKQDEYVCGDCHGAS